MSNVYLCATQLSIDLPLNIFILFTIVGFATFRLTKVITSDIIFENIRNSFIVWVSMKKEGGWHTGWRSKIAYLVGCDLCVGIWISLLFTMLLQVSYGFENLILFFLFWIASAGLQSYLHLPKG